MEALRKVYTIIEGVLVFLGLKISTTGETRPIVYTTSQNGRNEISQNASPRKNRKPPKITTVITDYTPTEIVHHSKEGFAYNIADRPCKRWTDVEWEKALKSYEKGYDFREIAEELDRTYESVRAKFADMRRKKVI